MEYYYDINLHFDDSYINYYMWDSFEHFNRVAVYKVDSVRVFLENEVEIESEYKNIIVSDGIISLGLEIINKHVAYVSSLPYEDEFKINKMVVNLESLLDFNILGKKKNIVKTNIDKAKDIYLYLINKGNKDFIRFLFYEITGQTSNDINQMKRFLISDIKSHFSDKYYQLYDMITIGD